MSNRVVCISTTDGAAGEEVAALVADRLGFRVVDEAIVARAAQEAGIGGDVWASIFDAGEVWQIRPS